MHPRLNMHVFGSDALRVVAALVLLTLGACGGTPKFTETLPASFGLSLTVTSLDQESADPLHRSARFVLETDGWLRAGTGPGAIKSMLPPRVRRLSHEQRQKLWDLTRASGLLDPDCPVRMASGDGPVPTRAMPYLQITARTDSGRFAGVVELESVLGEPYEPMLARLHEWAWVGE